MQDLIENYPQRPNINRISVVMEPSLLRRNVLLSASDGFHNYFLSAQPKICYLDDRNLLVNDVLGLEQDVLGLQVAMGDPMVMELLYALADLVYALEGVLLVHSVVGAAVERIPR